MKNTITQGYKIATEDAFLEKLYPTPKGLEEKMPKLYQMAMKGKSAGVDIILKEIKRYPKYPDLKTLLALLYDEMGRNDKADEIQLKLAKEHPEYFTGRLNAAFIHFDNDEYHLMEEILSKGFDLKTMYPDRDVFHIQEVVLMQKAAVFYYGIIGDIDQAKIRLEIMEKLAPDSEDFQIASDQLNINILHHRLKDTSENAPLDAVRNAFSKMNALVKRPKFHFEIINELFENGDDIPQGLIDEIMELPRKELIEDLEAVVKFSIDNFEEISSHPVEEYKTFYVAHAIYLLADLEAYESFSVVIDVFKQNEDYNHFYFGDFITDLTWDPLTRLAINNLDTLVQYMKLPNIFTYNKAVFPEVLEQMVYHYPQKKEAVMSVFEELLTFYLNTDSDACIDPEVNAFLIWSLINLTESRFNQLIEALYEKELIDEEIVGTKEYVFNELNKTVSENTGINKFLSLRERFNSSPSNIDFIERIDDENDYAIDPPKPNEEITENRKIQRNDPCPCGSGKKYKKCCLNK